MYFAKPAKPVLILASLILAISSKYLLFLKGIFFLGGKFHKFLEVFGIVYSIY